MPPIGLQSLGRTIEHRGQRLSISDATDTANASFGCALGKRIRQVDQMHCRVRCLHAEDRHLVVSCRYDPTCDWSAR
ncbi:hypothetical protein PXO_02806 [Xanthomonas oryzae pv. oryzae PXO99A]|uniref:Uncharacterized protein n=1 Tax=Xanthomonas oryzae pv. oryzae (strain PXO99A) TaxID=360094 RepID=A0A0K0GR06_XANOP|nr:hypothetical protein PXO_02806 [Xanthomonas oryzae pv. oryzae PXO99A]